MADTSIAGAPVNIPEMAKAAYAQGAVPVRTEKGTEYEAFAKVTHRLRVAAARGQNGFSDLAAAIHDNRRLWMLLAADVANADNQLPEVLRARIFYLAEFSAHHGSRVLAGKEDVMALVDVNATIMQGLRPGGGHA
jgi:flagellar protein FlaF